MASPCGYTPIPPITPIKYKNYVPQFSEGAPRWDLMVVDDLNVPGFIVSSVMKWSQRFRETGSAAAYWMGGNRPSVLEPELGWLLARYANQKIAYGGLYENSTVYSPAGTTTPQKVKSTGIICPSTPFTLTFQ